MATDRSFGNMINQMPVTKKVLKEVKPMKNVWKDLMKKK